MTNSRSALFAPRNHRLGLLGTAQSKMRPPYTTDFRWANIFRFMSIVRAGVNPAREMMRPQVRGGSG